MCDVSLSREQNLNSLFVMGRTPICFLNPLTQVLWDPVDVTYVDDQIIVVSKPCSIPVHPVGRYKVH